MCATERLVLSGEHIRFILLKPRSHCGADWQCVYGAQQFSQTWPVDCSTVAVFEITIVILKLRTVWCQEVYASFFQLQFPIFGREMCRPSIGEDNIDTFSQ